MDLSNSEWLTDLSMPKTGGKLRQYIHCCRWMSTAIPAFEQIIAPLSDILERAYETSGRRKKKSIENMELSLLSWGANHERAFRDLQTSILNSTKLAYPKKVAYCAFILTPRIISGRSWSRKLRERTFLYL